MQVQMSNIEIHRVIKFYREVWILSRDGGKNEVVLLFH